MESPDNDPSNEPKLIDRMIVPPPISIVTEPVDESNQNIPGEIVVDRDGKLLKKYFVYDGFTGDTIAAYDDWILRKLPMQINSRPVILNDGSLVKFTNVTAYKPTFKKLGSKVSIDLTPRIARENMYTYSGEIFSDLVREKDGVDIEEIKNVNIGRVPVMLGSYLCHLRGLTPIQIEAMGEDSRDPFAYFIINGSEKVVLIQEKLRMDRIFLFNKKSKGDPMAKMTCSTIRGTTGVSLTRDDKKSGKGDIRLSLHFLKKDDSGNPHTINIFQLFRLFDITSFEDMLNIVLSFTKDEWKRKVWFTLQPSIGALYNIGDDVEDINIKRMEREKIRTMSIDEQKKEILEEVHKELFPQMNQEENFQQKKLYMFAMMVVRFAEYLAGLRPLDDRDNWSNKRLETAGRSLETLFGGFDGLWKNIIDGKQGPNPNGLKAQLASSKNVHNLSLVKTILESLIVEGITENFISAYGPNAWGSKGSHVKENITEALQRKSLIYTYSHMTQINTPISRNSKTPGRLVQMSQLGYVDAVESPEGATCLTLDTQVLLADGVTTVPIAEVGDRSIISVNPVTLKHEITQIKDPFQYDAASRGHKLYEVTTISGRTIKGTDDHPMLTQRGWVEIQNLTLEDKFCVWNVQDPMSMAVDLKPIMTEDIFIKKVRECGVTESRIEKYVKDLTLMKLIPLYSADIRVPILARIAGFVWTDGTLAIYDGKPTCAGVFGTLEDAEQFERDVNLLGCQKCKISERDTQITDKETGRVTDHHTFRVQHGNCFATLLMALGVIYGKKTDVPTPPIPDWILNGSQMTKREWLAGFQGGDGSSIYYCKRASGKGVGTYAFSLPPTSQHKEEIHADTLVQFMESMRILFLEFGVETTDIKTKKSYGKIRVELSPNCSEKNIINYMKKIGYRYAKSKVAKSNRIVEYLMYKQDRIQDEIDIRTQIKNRYDNGEDLGSIANDLKLPKEKVRSIAKASVPTAPRITTGTMTIEYFFTVTAAPNDHLGVPVKSIKEIPSEMVADFTTVSDNHSFIANGCCGHNCGLIKHKSTTCWISLERDEKDVRDYIEPYINSFSRTPEEIEEVEGNEIAVLEKRREAGIAPPTDQANTALVLNGKFLGWCQGETLRKELVRLRRSLAIGKDTCIVLDSDNVLHVYTDGARPTRPLLVVNDETHKLVIQEKNLWGADFETLLREGCVEYIDSWEQESIMLAMKTDDIEFQQKALVDAEAQLEAAQAEYDRLTSFLQISSESSVDNDGTVGQKVIEGVVGSTTSAGNKALAISNTHRAFIGDKVESVRERKDPGEENRQAILDVLPEQIETVFQGFEVFISPSTLDWPRLKKLYLEQVDARSNSVAQIQYDIQVLSDKRPYTHSEIDPNAMFSDSSSLIPLSSHNQGPRNCYTSAQSKQALGIYHSNYHLRFDTTAKVLAYPSRPILETQMAESIGATTHPAGEMAIIAFMAYGFNQEDAILLNKGSSDRGLLDYFVYRSYKAVQKSNETSGTTSINEKFAKPTTLKPGEDPEKYSNIDEDGVVKLGSIVKTGDPLIVKIRTIKDKKTEHVEEKVVATTVGIGEGGVVDRVLKTTNPNGKMVIKVKTREYRKQTVGGKIASRSAQKSTIGQIVPEVDMPFSTTGIRPDLIINPHAIPSRMTIGKLLEIVASKAAALRGERVNATAFKNFNIEEFQRNLVQYGYSYKGEETMYNGKTGEEFQAQIFMGPCYYQALPHHVEDKIQARQRGFVQRGSGQSVKGELLFALASLKCVSASSSVRSDTAKIRENCKIRITKLMGKRIGGSGENSGVCDNIRNDLIYRIDQ